MEKIFKKITTLTAISYIVSLIIFLLVFLMKNGNEREATRVLSTYILIGATVFAVAVPILIRTAFYSKSYKKQELSELNYLRMKVLIIISVFIGTLFALYAYYYPIYKYHLYLSVLASLWGIYSILPSKKIFDREVSTYFVDKEE